MQDAGKTGTTIRLIFFLAVESPSFTARHALDGTNDASPAGYLPLPQPMNLHLTFFRLFRGVVSFVALGMGTLLANESSSSKDVADGRAALVAQIDRNVESGRRVVSAVRAQIHSLDEETREEFTEIEEAVQSAEKRLRRSLKAAESASPENWSRARAALAANYEAYAQAVSEAERLMAMASTSMR